MIRLKGYSVCLCFVCLCFQHEFSAVVQIWVRSMCCQLSPETTRRTLKLGSSLTTKTDLYRRRGCVSFHWVWQIIFQSPDCDQTWFQIPGSRFLVTSVRFSVSIMHDDDCVLVVKCAWMLKRDTYCIFKNHFTEENTALFGPFMEEATRQCLCPWPRIKLHNI